MQSELKGIVHWLKGTDEMQWASKTALAKNCLATMRQRAKPVKDPNKPGSGTVVNPHAEKINKAIPHVEAMLSAMQGRGRAKALESATAAVAEMRGVKHHVQ
jgi:hypothetical protein